MVQKVIRSLLETTASGRSPRYATVRMVTLPQECTHAPRGTRRRNPPQVHAAQPHWVFAPGVQWQQRLRWYKLNLHLQRLRETRAANSLKDCVLLAGPFGPHTTWSSAKWKSMFMLTQCASQQSQSWPFRSASTHCCVLWFLRWASTTPLSYIVPTWCWAALAFMACTWSSWPPLSRVCSPINVLKVNLKTIKQRRLISYSPYSQDLDSCHYSIKIILVGTCCGMMELSQEKFTNISYLQDMGKPVAMVLGCGSRTRLGAQC